MIGLAVSLAIAAATGGPPATPAGAAITGHVVLKPGDALPAGSVVHVRLEVAAAPERAARRVAETTEEAPPTGPIPFRLEYDASQIDSTKQYLVRATISVGGRTAFASRGAYPVLTHGAPAKAEIQVEKSRSFRVGGTTAAALDARLSAAPWILVSVGDSPAIPGRDGPPRLVVDAEKPRISGSTGCNSFFGSYTLEEPGRIGLDPAGMTMMACSDNLSKQETAFVGALRAATAYRISGAALELLDGDRVLARFESGSPAAASD